MFLAVKNRLPSIRRCNLETDAEILACEVRPDSRRKILAVVFYRPQDTDLEYLKQLKKTFLLASKAKFDQILVIGDFNLSEIDWQTGMAIAGDCLHNYFTKLVKDNYLWQLVDFPTRGKNILDLILTTIPTKVQHIHGFDDIICTDHKLISFELDLKVPKRLKTYALCTTLSVLTGQDSNRHFEIPRGTHALFPMMPTPHLKIGMISLLQLLMIIFPNAKHEV